MPQFDGYWSAASMLAVVSLDEVAAELGVTRQRAQQIEAKALEKVRRKLAARGLTLEDFVNNIESAPPSWQNIRE